MTQERRFVSNGFSGGGTLLEVVVLSPAVVAAGAVSAGAFSSAAGLLNVGGDIPPSSTAEDMAMVVDNARKHC